MEILDEFLDEDKLFKSCKVMGILKNNRVVLEEEPEQDSLYDFNVYEKWDEGESGLSKYIRKHGYSDEAETERLLRAMADSESGLYEVVDTDKENYIIKLKAISDSDKSIQLMDLSLSQMLEPGKLIFARLTHLENFSMTSGIAFVFRENHREYLLQRSKKLIKKAGSGDPSADRFIAFFYLNRSDGMKTMLQSVE
ncbi:hypothetical protein B9T62_36925 [Paenibacillus donghaensis]|uniref:Uncharacterized protein n=2 Tax=Paenibacillus donghaensis TaxID=414771 RepID=A0A2Z2KYU1_9BACL|nr:hypothetical protein B9T62_36925 [Paenibacillus donghaensis]